MSITATAFNGNELIIRVCILIEATDIFMYPMLIAKRAFQNSTARRNFIHVIQPHLGGNRMAFIAIGTLNRYPRTFFLGLLLLNGEPIIQNIFYRNDHRMVTIVAFQLNFFIGNAYSPRYPIANLTILFNNRSLTIGAKDLIVLFLNFPNLHSEPIIQLRMGHALVKSPQQVPAGSSQVVLVVHSDHVLCKVARS